MRVLLCTLPGDMHTQGQFNFSRIARDAGFSVIAQPPRFQLG